VVFVCTSVGAKLSFLFIFVSFFLIHISMTSYSSWKYYHWC